MYLNSRELQREFDELDSEYNALKEELDNVLMSDIEREDIENYLKDWENDNWGRYDNLKELIDNLENESEWQYSMIFIPEDEFEEYTQQYCKDMGLIGPNLPDFIEVNWEQTAENFSADFSQVEFENETYYYRA